VYSVLSLLSHYYLDVGLDNSLTRKQSARDFE